jgi:hypothetical protein
MFKRAEVFNFNVPDAALVARGVALLRPSRARHEALPCEPDHAAAYDVEEPLPRSLQQLPLLCLEVVAEPTARVAAEHRELQRRRAELPPSGYGLCAQATRKRVGCTDSARNRRGKRLSAQSTRRESVRFAKGNLASADSAK